MARAAAAKRPAAPKRAAAKKKPRPTKKAPAAAAKTKARAAKGPGLLARAWAARRSLRESFEAQLSAGYGEERLLAYCAIACIAAFLFNLPEVLILGEELDTEGQIANLAGSFIAYVFFAPLFFYGLAGLTHLVASKLFGGQGSHFSARVALFWTLMLCIPLGALSFAIGLAENAGYLSGFGTVFSYLLGIAFLWIWTSGVAISEGFSRVFTFLFVCTAGLCIAGLAILASA